MVEESEMNEIWQKCGKDFEQKTVVERTKVAEGIKVVERIRKICFEVVRQGRWRARYYFFL